MLAKSIITSSPGAISTEAASEEEGQSATFASLGDALTCALKLVGSISNAEQSHRRARWHVASWDRGWMIEAYPASVECQKKKEKKKVPGA
jgi:hypothetical protein